MFGGVMPLFRLMFNEYPTQSFTHSPAHPATPPHIRLYALFSASGVFSVHQSACWVGWVSCPFGLLVAWLELAWCNWCYVVGAVGVRGFHGVLGVIGWLGWRGWCGWHGWLGWLALLGCIRGLC